MLKSKQGAAKFRTSYSALTILRISFLLLIVSVFTACGKNDKVGDSNVNPSNSKSDEDERTLLDDTSTPLRIAAASNLAHTLPDLIEDYQQDNNNYSNKIEVTYGSSGKLYAQINAGAPYDIYLSANQTFPAKLSKNENTKYGKPFTYARGQLAFYGNSQNNLNKTPIDEIELSNLLNSDAKIAIANPELAPYGYATKTYLQSHRLYEPLLDSKQLIQTENIGQTLQYVQTGNVDYGFVALPQLKSLSTSLTTSTTHNNSQSTNYSVLPLNEYPAILQDGLVLTTNPNAIKFAEFLQYDSTQQQLQQAGYAPIYSSN